MTSPLLNTTRCYGFASDLRLERMQRGEPPLLFESCRFGLLPRHKDNSNIRWFEAPACYIFHTLNAYEQSRPVLVQ